MKIFILGGMKSGKSKLAEQYAKDAALPVTYIASATSGDAEMQARIAQHQAQRPQHWQLVEEPTALAPALQRHAAEHRCLLVDCLTLWMTNLLCAENQSLLQTEIDAFLKVLPTLPGQIILVSNETGMGIVPVGELTRRYCDEAGRLHQAVAQHCDKVILTVAGLPLHLKG